MSAGCAIGAKDDDMVVAKRGYVELVARGATEGAASGGVQQHVAALDSRFGIGLQGVKLAADAFIGGGLDALRAHGLAVHHDDISTLDDFRLDAAPRLWTKRADGLCAAFGKPTRETVTLRLEEFRVGACGACDVGKVANVGKFDWLPLQFLPAESIEQFVFGSSVKLHL